jgi:glyoxylase-like metal-dependent hydrolase (beta-lactamase superfamily II)
VKTRQIGSMQIQKVVELDGMALPATLVFPGANSDVVARGREMFDARFIAPDQDALLWSFHSYVVNVRGRNILIDTCHGNDKVRPDPVAYAHMMNTDYLGNLGRAGLRPEDIDMVLCTHLHIDHVGWNTRLSDGKWVPTFPNAKYLMTRADYERFEHIEPGDQEGAIGYYSFHDSVLPVVAAGQAELIETDHVIERELDEGIWMEGAPGHTPGSVVIHAQNGHGHALFAGDVIHHPIQMAWPSLHVHGEYDTHMGMRTRRRVLESCADTDTLLLPAHFPSPTAARVVSTAEGLGLSFEAE